MKICYSFLFLVVHYQHRLPKRHQILRTHGSPENRREAWIQVDLGKAFNVTAVQTQGRSGIAQWIDKFTLLYRTSKNEWKIYKDSNGATKVIDFD